MSLELANAHAPDHGQQNKRKATAWSLADDVPFG